MTGWRVAPCLVQLRDQVNAAHPARSKVSDGTIGDTAHAASKSDHNPDATGIVRALDITHDPRHGLDAGALAEQLRRSRDPRIKYVISNRRIFSSTIAPWTWRPYSGTDPHTSHVHVSVVADHRADSTAPWSIGTTQEDEVTPEDVKAIINGLLNADVIPSPSPSKTNPTFTVKSAIEWNLRRASQANSGVQRIEGALKALARTLPEASAQAVLDALAEDYDAEVTLTPKETP